MLSKISIVLLLLLLCVGLSCAVRFEDLNEGDLMPWDIIRPHKSNYTIFDVTDYGAKGDGISDDSQAFLDAWSDACQCHLSKVFIPSNKIFLVQPVVFSGPCNPAMKMQVDGTIVAPSDPSLWNPNQHIWLNFADLQGFTIEGNGKIDGQGALWWEKSCKVNASSPCHSAPTAVTLTKCNNTRVRQLTFVNSQQMHLSFDGCNVVRAVGLNVSAPMKSPNTDGIHLHRTTNAFIRDTIISTGDDCISIQSGCSEVRIRNVTCLAGHGISIGSLGKGGSSASVEEIVVENSILNHTTNGLRIKTWQGGRGYVRNVLYQNVRMVNVSNPIIIDQYYCDSPTPCSNQTSNVEVSGIEYRGIKGTSASHVAVRFVCSGEVGCREIVMEDVEIVGISNEVTSLCENAFGICVGSSSPQSCLSQDWWLL